jgi:tetratricopeptide (TPR) repeat protein
LLGLARAYEHMNKGDLAVEKGDMTTALAEYGSAAQISPDSAEMLYWQAVGLASHGDVDRAIPLFRRAFSDDPRWIEVTRRLHKPGLIPDTPEGRALVDRIIREAKP